MSASFAFSRVVLAAVLVLALAVHVQGRRLLSPLDDLTEQIRSSVESQVQTQIQTQISSRVNSTIAEVAQRLESALGETNTAFVENAMTYLQNYINTLITA